MTVAGFADLDGLDRSELLTVAHEYMHGGMMTVRSTVGPTLMEADAIPDFQQLPIPQWMGASPVYTQRTRDLMGIEGDDVSAIIKALQLDVGFVHGYMDVVYEVQDPTHAEFWLRHCGALVDVEPVGEDQVRYMCHDIEDPTFDATALATNPCARIRPIHRPPRTPADRDPHCHWTIIIDEENDPIGPMAHTDRVRALALASVPNEIAPGDDAGRSDYRGPLDPEFRLAGLTDGALAAVAREFQMQSHLLVASVHLEIADRADERIARIVSDDSWATFGWLMAERLARVVELGEGAERVARAVRLTPVLSPGYDRRVEVAGDHLTITLTPAHDGIDDPDHPGWVGSLARGVTSGVEGIVGGLGFGVARIETSRDGSSVVHDVDVDVAPADRAIPDLVGMARIGGAPVWDFQPLTITVRR